VPNVSGEAGGGVIEIKLDDECFSCSGTGALFDRKTNNLLPGVCIYCRGTGRSFTNAGASLAQWLERHYGLVPKVVVKPEAA
jgi:hypothetical protein